MKITIERVTQEDLPGLAEINWNSHGRITIAQISIRDYSKTGEIIDFFKARLIERLNDTNTQLYKAVESATCKAVGFIGLTISNDKEQSQETEQPLVETASSQAFPQLPAFMHRDFVIAGETAIAKLKASMEDGKHYYISTFSVEPIHQSKGVGSQLLNHCLQIADQAKLNSWLIAFPGAHDLFLSFGFEDVDHVDFDLNHWDQNRLRGYGIFRQYAMMRRPVASHISG